MGCVTLIRHNFINHFELADVSNRYFQVGCKTFTRHELLAYGGMDLACVENCLCEWESRGFIQVLKPLKGAQDGDIIVNLLNPIQDQEDTTGPDYSVVT
jgi:hypothetical protein